MLTENEVVRLVFGLKVRSLRQEKNLSYQQLSEHTGLALSYLHDIENGKKYPKANKILALGKALGVDYDYLVSLTGGKKLQPMIDLISSDLVNTIPWEHFGLSLSSLLSLFSNTPDKVTAFISTLIKIFRSYEMSRERFYNTSLRSYQDLHDNYFDELETASAQFRTAYNIEDGVTPSTEALTRLAHDLYGIKTDHKKMAAMPALAGLRAFFSQKKKILYLNKLTDPQEAFIVARELGFQYLRLEARPFTTVMQQPRSFDVVLNNFKASYFAAALLIPEDNLVERITTIVRQPRWNGSAWLDMMTHYRATPEMFLQRLSNILPRHFGADQLFFLRMTYDAKHGDIEMTKELHLSHLHNPHANAVNEHYCRRWVATRTMQEAGELSAEGKYKKPVIGVQISQYWQTHNRYLCISIARPAAKGSPDAVSVTIGLELDKQLQQSMPFVNDMSIPVVTVNTTCERCSITDCLERAAPPVVIEQKAKETEVEQTLLRLDD